MAESTAENRLKVFISYSRADANFATQLRTVLDVAGFSAIADVHEVMPGEDWQSRLPRLIEQAHTILFVLSPDSLRSQRVAWEVQHAANLSKRLLPVVRRSRGTLEDSMAPEPLRRLNYIQFDEHSFGEAISQIVTAIRADETWIRLRTEIEEQARRWSDRDRAEELLPRGNLLTEMLDWLQQRPGTAPAPTSLQVAYIAAAEQKDNERTAARVQRWIAAGRPRSLLLGKEELANASARLARQIRAGETPSEVLRELVVASEEEQARRKRAAGKRASKRGKIFISYRRDDARYCAGRLYDWLALDFGAGNIFIDVDTITKGRDFAQVLNEHLDQVDVMLVLIGSNWLAGTDAAGNRRIDDPNDYVRRELKTALTGAVAVIPVLIDGAPMPTAKELPEDLVTLTFRQNYTLTFENFARDVEGLKRHVAGQLQRARRPRWLVPTLLLIACAAVAAAAYLAFPALRP